MEIVVLTALGVGGATVFGSVVGFIFKRISARYASVSMAFAAGIMLAASFLGLIIPALECGSAVTCGVGIICGALAIGLLDKAVPSFALFMEKKSSGKLEVKSAGKVMLFVLAIAIHNFPEGIAAGVGFGSGDLKNALLIAGGIALQNIPEGMVIISPMLSVGFSPRVTLLSAALTGVFEIVGTFIGYYAVCISERILTFALAFAGGTMLCVIAGDMIAEFSKDGGRKTTYALLLGVWVMLIFSELCS